MKCSDFRFVKEDSAFSGVIKIAKKVCNDLKLVTSKECEWIGSDALSSGDAKNTVDVIFGTAGKSALLDKYAAEGIISLDKIRGKNEVYSFTVTDSQIIIAGSDKRGTIYGLFHLSELAGVSPLVNWADVLPVKKETIELENGTFISK